MIAEGCIAETTLDPRDLMFGTLPSDSRFVSAEALANTGLWQGPDGDGRSATFDTRALRASRAAAAAAELAKMPGEFAHSRSLEGTSKLANGATLRPTPREPLGGGGAQLDDTLRTLRPPPAGSTVNSQSLRREVLREALAGSKSLDGTSRLAPCDITSAIEASLDGTSRFAPLGRATLQREGDEALAGSVVLTGTLVGDSTLVPCDLPPAELGLRPGGAAARAGRRAAPAPGSPELYDSDSDEALPPILEASCSSSSSRRCGLPSAGGGAGETLLSDATLLEASFLGDSLDSLRLSTTSAPAASASDPVSLRRLRGGARRTGSAGPAEADNCAIPDARLASRSASSAGGSQASSLALSQEKFEVFASAVQGANGLSEDLKQDLLGFLSDASVSRLSPGAAPRATA